MTVDEVAKQIARRPEVHRLCYGAFLQAPVWISPDVLAFPLTALGFKAEFGYIGDYLRQFFGIELPPEEARAGRAQGDAALPVITVIYFPRASALPNELETGARASLERAEQIIAWTTGDRLTEFAYVTVTDEDPLEQIVKLEREMNQVQTKYKDAEQSYGSELLNLVVARGFLAKLLENEAIQDFIGGAQPEILAHFQMIVNAATIEEEIASQSGDDLLDAAE